MTKKQIALPVLLATCFAAANAIAQPLAIQGAGATFPAKVYQHWIESFATSTGVSLAYDAVGSSTGRKRISGGEVDFGATDVPMSNAELSKYQLFQFPTLVGGVVPVVNLPGVAAGALRLDNETLVAIFAGRETRWDAPSIRALNPTLTLPNLPIRRVVRKDGSGTTEVFVGHLHSVGGQDAQAIQEKKGHAIWPGSTLAVEGSSMQSSAIKATLGSIGYISSDYVVRDGLAGVQLRNRRGDWVSPTLASFRAAIVAGGLFKNSLQPKALLNIDGVGVWPIVTATYILVPRTPVSVERAGHTLNFFYQSFLLGDKAVASTGFAPLPIDTQAKIVAQLAALRTSDGTGVPMFGMKTLKIANTR